MKQSPDYFAQAERLARWAHVTLGVEGHELEAVLQSWRGSNGVPLSDLALAIVSRHTTHREAERRQAAA
jgi:hypothetical protein